LNSSGLLSNSFINVLPRCVCVTLCYNAINLSLAAVFGKIISGSIIPVAWSFSSCDDRSVDSQCLPRNGQVTIFCEEVIRRRCAGRRQYRVLFQQTKYRIIVPSLAPFYVLNETIYAFYLRKSYMITHKMEMQWGAKSLRERLVLFYIAAKGWTYRVAQKLAHFCTPYNFIKY